MFVLVRDGDDDMSDVAQLAVLVFVQFEAVLVPVLVPVLLHYWRNLLLLVLSLVLFLHAAVLRFTLATLYALRYPRKPRKPR